jgi:2-amino-4-hydroxy-6-hydroxymethyldihydropteridine diphosphokinase
LSPLTAYLGLGSNIGSREDKLLALRSAVRLIAEHPRIRVAAVSPAFESKAWGFTDQPDFVNAALRVETDLSPRELLGHVQDVERALGRTKTFRWGPRLIDVDLLLYGNLAISEVSLEVPHPRMLERSFVVVPLLRIAPDARLPDGRFVRSAAKLADGDKLAELGGLFVPDDAETERWGG